MKWASAVSVDPVAERGVASAASEARDGLGGIEPDLVVAFVSEHHRAAYEGIPKLLSGAFPKALLLGCSAGGVIGAGREIEGEPGVSVTAASLPGVDLAPIRLDSEVLAGIRGPQELPGLLGVAPDARPHFLLLVDPFRFDSESFLVMMDAAYPASRKVGGLASGGREPESNALLLADAVYRSGLVGVACSGDIEVDTIVAQGCRPVGEPMFVTRCRHNVLLEVDGRPPLEVLQELYRTLDSRDRDLFRHSLFVGIVMQENREQYRRGDFLIRNLVGVDESIGALAIGALLHEGSVVQFHLRDARTSAEDLEELLSREESAPAGSLLFSCLGRGRALYGHADHDTEAFRRRLGPVALGGFFCNGEIGPVQGRTFLHGYTSSFGLFRPRRGSSGAA